MGPDTLPQRPEHAVEALDTVRVCRLRQRGQRQGGDRADLLDSEVQVQCSEVVSPRYRIEKFRYIGNGNIDFRYIGIWKYRTSTYRKMEISMCSRVQCSVE